MVKTFWLAKDEKPSRGDSVIHYTVNDIEMKPTDDGYNGQEAFCKPMFEKLTGLVLIPGEQVQIKLSIVKGAE